MTAKILTTLVSVTRRRISSTLRHSTNICAWRKHLAYKTSFYCCHRFPWLSKWHHSHVNPLDVELNPICHLLVLSGAHQILHISRIRVKLRVSIKHIYIYIYCPTLTNKTSHLCVSEIFFMAFVGVIKLH